MAVDLAALKTELTTDPAGIGYAPLDVARHVAIAKLVNKSDRQVQDTADRPTWQLASILPVADVLVAVSIPAKAAMLQMLLSLPTINPDDKGLRNWMLSIFGAATPVMTAWNKWSKKTGTRGEELGFGRVTESDVADALRV